MIKPLSIGDKIEVERHGTDHFYVDTYYVVSIYGDEVRNPHYKVAKNEGGEYCGWIDHKQATQQDTVKFFRKSEVKLPEDMFTI